jgi:methylated-DNA-protein-cysteine methyltransferase related protein
VAPQAPRAAGLSHSTVVVTVPTVDLDSPSAQRILARVRAIPPGFVSTYGDCSPGAPRVTGAVLAACPSNAAPWHRVVRADGSLAKGARQRALLDAEGVPFRGARVDLRVARAFNL